MSTTYNKIKISLITAGFFCSVAVFANAFAFCSFTDQACMQQQEANRIQNQRLELERQRMEQERQANMMKNTEEWINNSRPNLDQKLDQERRYNNQRNSNKNYNNGWMD